MTETKQKIMLKHIKLQHIINIFKTINAKNKYQKNKLPHGLKDIRNELF